MNNHQYIDKIIEIINSENKDINFKLELETIANNFPNLKLENQIRNSLVVLFNKLSGDDLRALAEYPRYSFKGASRVSIDFSVCKNRNVDFTMEMKYNFPNDDTQMTHYSKVIRKNFLNRKYGEGPNDFVDAFMLIIGETDKVELKKFEKTFNTPNLNSTSQFQISPRKKKKTDWATNLQNSFETIKKEALEKGVTCELNEFSSFTITTIDKITMKFYFYMLYRK